MSLPTLTSQILPEIDFNILSTGITINSNERLSTPRFIPYDQCGRCRECKATEVELDFIVTKDGVTVYCSRIKGPKFVAFDNTYELPGYCFFRIKNKGRVFNIPHGEMPPPKNMQPNIPPYSNIPPPNMISKPDFEQFLGHLNAMRYPMNSQIQKPNKETNENEDIKIIEEFLKPDIPLNQSL
jgi:hypothetical protein